MITLQAIYLFTLVLLTSSIINIPNNNSTSIKMAISKQDHLRLEKSLEQINRLFLAIQSSELPLFIELRQQILRYNKRYKKCSQLEGWEFPSHAIKVLNIGESLAVSHPEEEIDVSNFTAAVLQWRAEMETFFEQSTISYGKVRINVTKFATKLSRYQSPLPLVSLLYKEWQGVLSKQGEELLGEELFDVLQTHKGTIWQMTSDLAALEAHYKKYKRSYKKHSGDMEIFQRSAMPKTKYFLDALLVSSSKEDPNLPENKAKVEEEQRELEKEHRELKSKYALYLDNYTIVLGRELNAIKVSNPTSLSDTLNMDMKALFRNLSAALDSDRSRQAPLGKDLWAYANKNFSSQPYYEMEDVRELFNTWCKNLSSKSPWYEEQFEFWKKHKEGFPNPSLIAAAINNAYIDINADTIRQHLVEWTKSVKDAFVLSKNYTIILQNAQKHFKELFEEQSNKGMSTLFFYEDILEPLLQQHGAKTTLEQLKNTVWEKALLQVVDQQRIANYFGEWRVDYGPYVVKAFNEELDTLLPSTEEIRQALLKSVERKRELLLPKIEVDSLKMDLIIRSPKLDQLEIKKKLLVHLAYKNYPNTKNGRLTDFLTVVPTALLVGDGNSEASKSKIEVVQTNIKKTAIYPNGSASTSVKITFMAVTDVEKLFNSINTKDLNYKGQDLSGLLKKISVGGSVKGVGVKMGVEDIIYKSTNVEYFEVEFTVGSIVIEGKDKVIELQTWINSKDHNFKVTFADGSTFLGGQTFLRPKYDYK